MKTLSTLLALFAMAIGHSQSYQITYQRSSNGKPLENENAIVLFTSPENILITSREVISGTAEFPYEQTLVDVKTNSLTQIGKLANGKAISMRDTIAIQSQQLELLPDTKKILGYTCKHAKTVINSNTIDIWYTDALKVKGGPNTVGVKLGLVLEMTRNNNFSIVATKIEKKPMPTFPDLKLPNLDALTYKDLLWKSRFTTISIFSNETINFNDGSKSNDSILRFANGTIALRKIKMPEIKDGSGIFLDVSTHSNGDAYDRTGSIFLIPSDAPISFLDGFQKSIAALPVYENDNGKQYQGVVKTASYTPLLELMRFFTPFGVGHYNTLQLKGKTWQDSVNYRQDISEFRQVLDSREVWIGAFIGNYDKGGHKISANITIHAEENAKSSPKFILPIFNTTNVMEMAGQEYGTMFDREKGLEVSFILEKPLKNARIRYITTGHGGWENGDEFVQKKNTISVDGRIAHSFIPWRTDCGSYRNANPASGNFQNGLSSSDYSRSNWCPGTTTNPIYIELGDLSAGQHTIQVQIPQGAPEGSSFSAWNISGVLIGE